MVLKLSPQQIQKTILAPAMQQSIEMLMLPLVDLSQAIEIELQENPLLEVVEEVSEKSMKEIQEEVEHRIKYDDRTGEIPYYGSYQDDEAVEDRPLKGEVSLEDSLLQQMRFVLESPLEQKIGELIIGNIDEDGFLKTSLEEIAQLAETDSMELVRGVLASIQTLEPIGIASRDLKECLLCQATITYNGHSKLIYQIIEHHLNALGQKKFQDIARQLKVSLEEVKEAARLIARLEPKPARNHRPISPAIYIKPDAIITKNSENIYQIQINDEGVPHLRISPFYKSMLQTKKLGPEEREFIREKIKNALHFMKSIEQRGQTIRGIATYILERQRDFFENGHMSLAPMTLKDVATALERNESTISRAISNKYIDTPKGTFPMKFFFSQGLSEEQNNLVATRCIKEEIKDVIELEDKHNPLSDSDIQKYFEEKGLKVARRTISKYRQASRILPSHLRKH